MKGKKIVSVLLLICIFISSINFEVYGKTISTAKYDIEVAVNQGSSIIGEMDTFESDLGAAMVRKGVESDNIRINIAKQNNITADDESLWNIYDHYYSPTYEASDKSDSDKLSLLELAGRVGQPFYYYKESSTGDMFGGNNNKFYTSPYEGTDSVNFRDKHIYVDGQRITFLGYSNPGYNDFMIYPNNSTGDKTIEYSVYLDGVDTHTLDGAGFFINSFISGSGDEATVNGYLIYYKYSGFAGDLTESLNLYKLDNVNVNDLHEYEYEDIMSIYGVSLVEDKGNVVTKVSGTSVKDIKIEIINNKLHFYEKDGEKADDIYHEVDSLSSQLINTGNGFGPYVDYTSHGCTVLTKYTYDNLVMKTKVYKRFDEKVLETSWKDESIHALVNVDDSGIINFDDDSARAEILTRLMDKDVHYIGWGNSDKLEEQNLFIEQNSNKGLYVNTKNEETNDYEKQVEAIAEYLVKLTMPTIDEEFEIIHDKEEEIITRSNNEDGYKEYWEYKDVDDENWNVVTGTAIIANVVTDEPKTSPSITVTDDTLINLVVEDEEGNTSETSSIYLSTNSQVKPYAQFEIKDSIDLEKSSAKAKVNNTSYDPYVGYRDLEYKWEVYSEMNKKVLPSSSKVEPEFNFSGLPAGTYSVRLTVTAKGDDVSVDSHTFVQYVKLEDTVKPKMSVNVKGTSSDATATITITDQGSGPSSYRIITTTSSKTITGAWLNARAENTVTKIYTFNPSQLKALSIEVKDGAGNIAIYPVDFSIPVVSLTPDGGNHYTNFDYNGEDDTVKIEVSSLSSEVVIKNFIYKWSESNELPDDINESGTLIEGKNSVEIPQPSTPGNYYIHILVASNDSTTSSAISSVYHIKYNTDNSVKDLKVNSDDGNEITLTWTKPQGASEQKLMYSYDNGETWVEIILTGDKDSITIQGDGRDCIFKLLVKDGEYAGISNVSGYSNVVKVDKETLEIGFAHGDNSENVTNKLTLPTTGPNGTTITWNSSLPDVIGNSGQVNRPAHGDGDKLVKLIATIEKDGYSVTKTFDVLVKAKPKSNKPSPNTSIENKVEVLVNGKPEIAGKEVKTVIDGKNVVSVNVNAETILKKINNTVGQGSSTENKVEIPVVTKDVNQLSVKLTGDVVKKMESGGFKLAVKTDKIEYVIPSDQVGIDKVAAELNISKDKLQKIEVQVNINQVDGRVKEKINEVAKNNGYSIVVDPIEFSVVALTTYANGLTRDITLSKFSKYVERKIEIPAGMDPSKITTGIVYNVDGTFSHIPTEVTVENGIYYAVLNSLTNSEYSVIWNPVTVASVQKHWSKVMVDDMASRLVVKNPETFKPDAAITRGDFAEYIVKALGVYRTGIAKKVFSDVLMTDEQADAIVASNAYGIINGYPDGTFRPDATITRQEAMAMFARAMKVIDLKSKDDGRINTFIDVKDVADWAKSDATAAVGSKIFNGRTEDRLEVLGIFTYAEAATAIRNLLIETELINK